MVAGILTGNDQLRQRVAFALSELFVVSTDTIQAGALPYANMLANDAFTNWYTIMNDVTLSPAMGIYLDMRAASPAMARRSRMKIMRARTAVVQHRAVPAKPERQRTTRRKRQPAAHVY